jgi:hypothetical protein
VNLINPLVEYETLKPAYENQNENRNRREQSLPVTEAGGQRPAMVSLPRWVVYFQAAMLGVIAATFFVFGLMVGSQTSGTSVNEESTYDCRVSGIIQFQSDHETLPDAGAVVFLLPRNGRPVERAAGSSVSPHDFEPLNNPGIEIVNRLGGSVVRADENGVFDVLVDGSDSGIQYYLLVVSRNQSDAAPRPLAKLQTAVIGTFFMPVERVINDRAIFWSEVTADRKKIALPKIEF